MPHFMVPEAAGNELKRIHCELTGALRWLPDGHDIDRDQLIAWRDELGAALQQFTGPQRRRGRASTKSTEAP